MTTYLVFYKIYVRDEIYNFFLSACETRPHTSIKCILLGITLKYGAVSDCNP